MVIRDRIKEFRRVPASELLPDPRNWRKHSMAQRDVLRGVLSEIGFADALLARETSDGRLMLIDGHMRAEATRDMQVPVLVLDVDEEEASKLLATLDPLGALAETDFSKLEELLRGVETENEPLAAMLHSMMQDVQTKSTRQSGPTIQQIAIRPPPRMSWALIGIPAVRYGEIQDTLERIGQMEDVVLETTANDG